MWEAAHLPVSHLSTCLLFPLPGLQGRSHLHPGFQPQPALHSATLDKSSSFPRFRFPTYKWSEGSSAAAGQRALPVCQALCRVSFFFWPCRTACGILVPQPGIEPASPALEAQSLDHWTTREVPQSLFIDPRQPQEETGQEAKPLAQG